MRASPIFVDLRLEISATKSPPQTVAVPCNEDGARSECRTQIALGSRYAISSAKFRA